MESDEINAMNRLISWCIDKKFDDKRILQLLTDWNKAGGNLIPLDKLVINIKKKK